MEQRGKESQAKYRQIADILRERIRRGRYKPGETIPSYPRLRELFEVSDITVRKAVALLVNENLLRMERGRGKGFFVMPPVPARGSGRRLPRRRRSFWGWARSSRAWRPCSSTASAGRS